MPNVSQAGAKSILWRDAAYRNVDWLSREQFLHATWNLERAAGVLQLAHFAWSIHLRGIGWWLGLLPLCNQYDKQERKLSGSIAQSPHFPGRVAHAGAIWL